MRFEEDAWRLDSQTRGERREVEVDDERKRLSNIAASN
jgi:hypothetical protein